MFHKMKFRKPERDRFERKGKSVRKQERNRQSEHAARDELKQFRSTHSA